MYNVNELDKLLTLEQQKMMPGVKFLVSDGPRASGRTFCLAVAFVKKAMNTDYPIKIWDHHTYHPNNMNHLIDMIHNIVDNINKDRKIDKFVIKYFHSNHTIQIQCELAVIEKPMIKFDL